MKIVITLPGYLNAPSGGYYVHYTYANHLQARGHDVTIIFPRNVFGQTAMAARFKAPFWAIKTRLRNRPLVGAVNLSKKIRIRLVSDLATQNLPDADVIIATAWQTAEALSAVPPRCGKKIYIVYDYEYFMTATTDVQARIARTYTSGFSIIATSAIVADMIKGVGGEIVANIPCGLDFTSFGSDIPPEQRAAFTLGFPVRHESFKGSRDAIEAAIHLHEKYGDKLCVTAFGSRPIELPDWINWLQYPSQNELRNFYNRQSVFLLPSHFEGWGLPAVEAMACGAALVTADNGGSRNFAFHETTALVTPPKRPDLLSEAVDRLFNCDDLRLRLAHAGHAYVQRYTWKSAVDALEKVLIQAT